MTLIVGGKHDLAHRSRQLDRARLSGVRKLVSDPGYQDGLRRRAAVFFEQFEKVSVVRAGKFVVEINGKYLAKLLRTHRTPVDIYRVLHYIKCYVDSRSRLASHRQKYPPSIPWSLVQKLEREEVS